MFKSYFTSILLSLLISHVWNAAIPVKLDAAKGNKGNLEFALQLPNNDTVQIDLSFQLLIFNTDLNGTTKGEDKVNGTSTDNITSTTVKPEPKYVTVDEAIEAFRQELIRKEKDIAGIIESDHPFYRHFKLQFEDNLTLTIRCTYDSNFKKRSLNITCYEYHEYETERILSNGEVEMIRIQDPNYKSDVEFIDARNVKQLYTMDIL